MTRGALLVAAVWLTGCSAMLRDPNEHVVSPYGDAEVVWKARTVVAPKGILVLKFRAEVPPERREYIYRMFQLKAARSYYQPAEEAAQVIFPDTWQKTLDDLLRRPEIDWVHPDLPPDEL